MAAHLAQCSVPIQKDQVIQLRAMSDQAIHSILKLRARESGVLPFSMRDLQRTFRRRPAQGWGPTSPPSRSWLGTPWSRPQSATTTVVKPVVAMHRT